MGLWARKMGMKDICIVLKKVGIDGVTVFDSFCDILIEYAIDNLGSVPVDTPMQHAFLRCCGTRVAIGTDAGLNGGDVDDRQTSLQKQWMVCCTG